jgi:hypothetical protein
MQRPDAVILACAISAGIHGALVPDHFDEGVGAGVAFVAATVILSALAALLTYGLAQLALLATVAAFGVLIAGYAAAVVTGLPVLHPEPEAVDALAVTTKAVEALGLVAAASLIRRPSFAIPLSHPKGTTT